MYNVSSGYLSVASSLEREVSVLITLALTSPLGVVNSANITDVDLSTVAVTRSILSGDSYVAGGFPMCTAKISLLKSSPTIAEMDFVNAVSCKATIQFGFKVGNTFEYVEMGVFYADKTKIISNSKGLINITASDYASMLKDVYDSSKETFPSTVKQLMSSVAYRHASDGISLDTTEVDSFLNSSVVVSKTFTLKATERNAFAYMAEALGGNAYITRKNKLSCRKLFSTPLNLGFTLDDDYLFSVEQKQSVVQPFQYVTVKADKDDIGVTSETKETTKCAYNIISNPILLGQASLFVGNIAKDTAFQKFIPTKIKMHGRPEIDAGDVLRFTHKGVEYLLPIATHTITYKGGFVSEFESVGSNSLEVKTTDPSLKTQIDTLKSSMNTFTRDLNETKSEIVDINGSLTQLSTITQKVNSIELWIGNSNSGAVKALASLDMRVTATSSSIALLVDNGVVKGSAVIEAINNQSVATISANKINLNGAISANGNFSVGTDGKITANGASIQGAITATSLTITAAAADNAGLLTPSNISGVITAEYIQARSVSANSLTITNTSGYTLLSAKNNEVWLGNFNVSSTSGRSYLSSGKYNYGDINSGVYIGTDGIGLGAAMFYVTSSGVLYASNANITGIVNSTEGKIGGWTLSSGSLYANSGTSYHVGMQSSTTSGAVAFFAGSSTPSSAPFRVTNTGYLYATNANISGTIYATSGTIGGCDISEDSLWYNLNGRGARMSSDILAFYGTVGYIIATHYLDSSGYRTFEFASYSGSGDHALVMNSSGCQLRGTWTLNSANILTSDVNAKNSISDIPEEYSTIFDRLRPRVYKYNDGTSNRLHTGFVAQEVKQTVIDSGLSTQDFAAYVEGTFYNRETGNYDPSIGLRYEEFIALCVLEIQKLKVEVTQLKAVSASKEV